MDFPTTSKATSRMKSSGETGTSEVAEDHRQRENQAKEENHSEQMISQKESNDIDSLFDQSTHLLHMGRHELNLKNVCDAQSLYAVALRKMVACEFSKLMYFSFFINNYNKASVDIN